MNGLLYFSGRLLKALLMIVAVLVLGFLLIRLAPGDPALLLAGEAGGTMCSSSNTCARPWAWTSRCSRSC